MNIIPFFSESYLKQHTFVDLNVDPKIVSTSILNAQDVYIQNAIGQNLYEKLQLLIQSNSIYDPENVNYKTLLDTYIIPALMNWTVVILYTRNDVHIKNRGVQTLSSDTSQPAEDTKLQMSLNSAKDLAEFYSQKIIIYLKDNLSLFPEYTTVETCNEIKPAQSAYFCGIQFPKRRYHTNENCNCDCGTDHNCW